MSKFYGYFANENPYIKLNEKAEDQPKSNTKKLASKQMDIMSKQ